MSLLDYFVLFLVLTLTDGVLGQDHFLCQEIVLTIDRLFLQRVVQEDSVRGLDLLVTHEDLLQTHLQQHERA